MFEFIKSRDVTIDLLRFFGLSLIILAHVNPPNLLFQWRVFDVPLMLFVSGLAFSGRKPDFSLHFFFKRVKRLVIPVYVFLTVYFSFVSIARLAGIDFGVRLHHVIGSYLLMDGIGYVWVIRVFLIVGIFTPLLLALDHKIKHHGLFLLIVVAILLVDEMLIVNKVGLAIPFVQETVYYGIGYGLIFSLGLRFNRFSPKQKVFVFVVAALGYAGLQLVAYRVGGVISIQAFKYPPRALFLLYGTMMSFLTVTIVKALVHNEAHSPKWMLFIGQNTIWIYLYHIPLSPLTGMVSFPWFVRFIVVYTASALVVYMQNLIVYKFKFPYSTYFIG